MSEAAISDLTRQIAELTRGMAAMQQQLTALQQQPPASSAASGANQFGEHRGDRPPRFQKLDFPKFDGKSDPLAFINRCESYFVQQRIIAEEQSFAQLLKAPQEEADAIIKERFPVPRLVVCDQYGSQARFLLAKLNPSVSYDNAPAPGGDVIFTDDVSFQVFMDHLQRLAVN